MAKKGGGGSAPPVIQQQDFSAEMFNMQQMINDMNQQIEAFGSISQTPAPAPAPSAPTPAAPTPAAPAPDPEVQEPPPPPVITTEGVEPNLPPVEEVEAIDWEQVAADQAAEAEADFTIDQAGRKTRRDTILTNPLLDDEEATTTSGSLLG